MVLYCSFVYLCWTVCPHYNIKAILKVEFLVEQLYWIALDCAGVPNKVDTPRPAFLSYHIGCHPSPSPAHSSPEREQPGEVFGPPRTPNQQLGSGSVPG